MFAAPNIYTERIEEESQLKPDYLKSLLKKHRCSYVMVEYNGMWLLDNLYNNLPDGWMVAQEFLFVDSTTFRSYNNNMRQLMVDKLRSCELAVFNRFPAEDEELKLLAHKVVRAVNRRCDIAFETADGKITYDDIELPLPYDLEAETVVIEDQDYAIFFQHMMENPRMYEGKKLQLKAKAITKTRKMRPGYFYIGRDVMTCCIDDIQFCGIPCRYTGSRELESRAWVQVTAKISAEKHRLYKGEVGPLLTAISVVPAQPAEPDFATF
jgi:hypothetical protein